MRYSHGKPLNSLSNWKYLTYQTQRTFDLTKS
nr:MAG TPA: hypothetical protein [Caudoviricetes sp.]DAR72253.1 MAG TPA: hypothetical protein [Caudoviricetes sp.]